MRVASWDWCRPGRCLPCRDPPKSRQRAPAGFTKSSTDGFRIIARRDASGVRLITRNGYDFSERFPLIVAAIADLKVRACVIDGEAIACDENGLSVFEMIRWRQHDHAVTLCAFDLLELNGEDLRKRPIEERKWRLAPLLRRSHDGIAINAHFEENGAVIYKAACALGCEGIASKRLGSPYRSGRTDHWLKVKNPTAPAVRREAEEDWGW